MSVEFLLRSSNMLVLLLCVIILCLAVWVQVRWGQVKRYWAKRNVPHDAPHPIMGSLTFLQRENPALFMKRMYQKFQSQYVGIWLFWRPGLIINSPEIGRRVLVKDFDVFRNRFLSSGKSDPVGALNVFTVNDPLWSSIRRRLSTAFTAAKLRAIQGIVVKKASDIVTRINKENELGKPINLRMLFTDFTTDVFGEAAFGISSESTLTGDSIMRKITREMSAFNLHRGLSWSSIFFFPELVDIFRLSFFPKETKENLRTILRTIIKQRGGEDRDIKEPKDFLDALLKIKFDAAKVGEDITEDIILAQAAIFLLGGFDTSGSVITWAAFELASHPDLQDKLYDELSKAKESVNGKDFDSTTLSELPYLNAVIKESLRKFPPMGWIDRVASRDYEIDENLTISAGTPVYVNAYGMHWDPEYFPEPEVFNPDRFLPGNESNILPYTFMPFGEGPRNCIGMRFGYQSVRYALASTIFNFELRPLPSTPKPNELEIEKKGLFLMPGETVLIQCIPRKNIN